MRLLSIRCNVVTGRTGLASNGMGRDGKGQVVAVRVQAAIALNLDYLQGIKEITIVIPMADYPGAPITALATNRAGLIFLGNFRQQD